jgi:hypothetical protein
MQVTFRYKGRLDLYSFELREDVRPIKTPGSVALLRYQNQGRPAKLRGTEDLKTGQRSSKVQTDEEGSYLITLPVGKVMRLTLTVRDTNLFENFPTVQNHQIQLILSIFHCSY